MIAGGRLIAVLGLLSCGGTLLAGEGKSALFRMDPKLIPPLERFDWQPKELVAVLGEHRGRQGNPVLCVAVSPDGKQVASGGSGGYVRLWDRTTMRLQKLLGHGYAASAITYSVDGTLLVVAGHNGAVQIWKMDKGVATAGPSVSNSSAALYAVAISPNNKYFAGGGADTAVHVWEFDDKGLPKVVGALQGHTGPVSSLAFADNKTLTSGGYDGTVRFWGLGEKQNRERSKFQAAAKEVRCLAYSGAGDVLATGDSDGNWRLWDMRASPPKETTAVATKYGPITSIAFGPRGSQTLGTGHTDNMARLWALGRPPREKQPCVGHIGAVNGVAFVPNSNSRATALLTASSDWTVRLWDLTGARPMDRTVDVELPKRTPKGHLSHVYTVDFSSDGKTVASGAVDTGIRLWDAGLGQPRLSYHYTKTPIIVYNLAYSPDGKTIAYGGADTNAYLLDPVRKWQIHRFTGHPSNVGNVIFSPDGKKLLTSSAKTAHLFDVESSKLDQTFTGHITPVTCIAMAPDGRRVLTGAGAIKYQSGQPVIVNGRYVYEDCTVRLWDADGGKELSSLKDHEVPILCMAFSRDGRFYYGMQEPVIRQYAFKDDKLSALSPLKGSGGYVYMISMSPDGKLMATVGLDGIVVWDAVSNVRLRQWALQEVCYRAIFSRDSRHIALPLGTGVIYVLRLDQVSLSDPFAAPGKK